jgi:hypothetical protein
MRAKVPFLIASGTVLGHRWTVTEYTGPWGRCFVLPGASDCLNGGLPVIEAGRLTQPMFSVPGGVHMTAVSPNVASVALDLSSGRMSAWSPVQACTASGSAPSFCPTGSRCRAGPPTTRPG